MRLLIFFLLCLVIRQTSHCQTSRSIVVSGDTLYMRVVVTTDKNPDGSVRVNRESIPLFGDEAAILAKLTSDSLNAVDALYKSRGSNATKTALWLKRGG